ELLSLAFSLSLSLSLVLILCSNKMQKKGQERAQLQIFFCFSFARFTFACIKRKDKRPPHQHPKASLVQRAGHHLLSLSLSLSLFLSLAHYMQRTKNGLFLWSGHEYANC